MRNFGQSAAHDVRFDFTHPPTVARYEDRADGIPDIAELQLPNELPVLAPGQEWRTVWDSAIDRNELAGSIRSRFDGTVTYYDRPRPPRREGRAWRHRTEYTNRVVLDWSTLQPVQRLELMTSHDLARQEKQKLELLRTVLTYFPVRVEGDPPRGAIEHNGAQTYSGVTRGGPTPPRRLNRLTSRRVRHPSHSCRRRRRR